MNKLIQKYKNLSVVTKATFWFLVCTVLQNAISMLTTPIFTRMMSTWEYGYFSLYSSWLQLFSIIITFKLNFGVFNKGMSKYPDSRDDYVSTMQFTISAIAVIFLCIYLIFSNQVNVVTDLGTGITVLIIAELAMKSAVDFWTLRQRYDFNYKIVVIVTIFISVFNTFTGLVAVYFSSDRGQARVVACIICDLIIGAVFYVVNIIKSNHRFVPLYAKYAIKFNMPLIPHYVSEYILDQSDRIMIKKMCSSADLGVYSVAYNLGMIIKILVTSINSSLIPWLYGKLEDEDFKKVRIIFKRIFILFIITIIAFILVAPEIMRIFAAKEYYRAIYVIPPIAGSVYCIFVFGLYGNIEFFYEKNKFTMYVSSMGAVANIVLNYIAIPVFGYIAAAYTTYICYVFFVIGHILFVDNVMKRKYDTVLVEFLCHISCIIVLTCAIIIVSILYEWIIIRYALILVICIYFIYNRKKIINFISEERQNG